MKQDDADRLTPGRQSQSGDRQDPKPETPPIAEVAEQAVGKVQAAAEAETTAAPVRRARAVVFQAALLALVAAFAVLTYLVSTSAFAGLDLQITLALQTVSYPPFAWLMALVSWAGYTPQSYLVTALIVLVLYGLGLRWEAMAAVASAVVSEALDIVVKVTIQRPRPAGSLVHVATTLAGFSFPSGHVTFYTGFFGFLWFVAYTLLRRSWRRTLLLVIFGGLVLLVGMSRVYLGEHWASDAVGAYLLGGLALVGAIQIYRWGKTRFFVDQPVARDEGSA